MTQIILNDDQAQAVQAARDAVEVRDRSGRLLGYVSPPPGDAEIAQAKRRLQSQGPWYTTEEVLEHLRTLEQG